MPTSLSTITCPQKNDDDDDDNNAVDDDYEGGGDVDDAHLSIVVLPTGPLQVVPSELEWVQVDLHTSVVDHVLGDRHRGGSSERSECSVAWSVRLANLAVDAEAGELVINNDGDDDDEYDDGNTDYGDGDEDAHLGNS